MMRLQGKTSACIGNLVGSIVSVLACIAISTPAHSQRPRGGANTAPSREIVVYAKPSDFASEARWRGIGPANFSGRIVDIAVHPEDSNVWYVASASGGLFKTENRGLTFHCVFENEGTISIGDIAIDPSDPSTVWVGTGEANNQRSSYWGDGIYKSTDGGKTWTNVGLRHSYHIGRIVVDPKDGDRVFVAALGQLYTPNKERGLYRTIDGGKTWQCVLSVDDNVGAVDVQMQPGQPRVLLAATYERRRRAWNFDGAGVGSGIWRSEDGGDTWKRVGGGLPHGDIGRIGLAFAAGEPNVVYATISNQNSATVKRRRTKLAADAGVVEGELAESVEQRRRRRTLGGEIYRSADAGKTWKKTNRTPVGGTPAYYYGQIRVDPSSAKRVWCLGVPLFFSKNGGKSFSSRGARGIHVDNHALWVDPEMGDHLLLGNDGGLHETWDCGKTWIHFENLPVAQFYAVGVDNSSPYRVYGGTQDNGTWGMPSAGPVSAGIRLEDVFKVSGGDGFYACVDPEDPNTVYVESQFGGLSRIDLKTMHRVSIRPRPGRGDARYRFNWNAPILVSPHNHETIYFGGNRLFKSLNRGGDWTAVSEDLTTADEKRLAGNVPHCTITSIAESPLKPGLLWVGTDDGRVWVSIDDGRAWRSVEGALPASDRHLWVSRVEASHFEKGRAYVSLTGYREDDFAPRLYVTDDYGLSFKAIHGDLPTSGPINVVREDPRNQDLLFVGTEFGVYVSLKRGGEWQRLGKGMPRVPVHDLIVHPRVPDVVAATHGRGMFVLDVCALEQWTPEATASGSVLIDPRTVRRFPRGPDRGYTSGSRTWTAPNPANGVNLCALVAGRPDKAALRVFDAKGDKPICEFELSDGSGLYVVPWDLRRSGSSGARSGFGGFFRNMRRGMRGRGRGVGAGTYRVELEVDGRKVRKPLVIVR